MADYCAQYDVRVKNAFKSYGQNSVINGLNINVTSGSIYCLLGPSGCGKTTLLQCILGTMTLDSGFIDINVNCLKDIGYMPQGLCLEETLTVKELFQFYGTLYNMSNEEINISINKLNEFLQLPNMNSYINQLSGGQSRRVSLAISMLHDPKIIILDEPTVGIDPLRREDIWAEFKKMAKEHKKTIVITTHYIEEANLADTIGLMRNGLIVEEESPQQMLTKYETQSLEECFLKACCNQQTNEIIQEQTQTQGTIQPNKLTTFRNNISLFRIKALLKKHYCMCYRDYLLIFSVIFIPIIQIVLFCLSVGTQIKDMPIVIKNDEINLLDCQSFNGNGCIFDDDNHQNMSCVILQYLKSLDYKLVEVKDRESGEIHMNDPNYVAFLYFPQNFTAELTSYMDNSEYYDPLTYARLTMDNFVFRKQITYHLLESIFNTINKILNDCSYNSKAYTIPLEFTAVYGHEVKSYANAIASFFLAMLTFHCASTFSLSTMTSEKMGGTLSRSMISGIKKSELVISIFVIGTIINVFQIFIMCYISFIYYSNPIQISSGIFVYFLLMLFISWIGTLYGIIAALVTQSKIGGVFIVVGFLLPQFLLSGGIWPVEGQPRHLRKLTELLPIPVGGHTMTDIALKGWTLSHPSIIIGTTMTFAYNILLLFVLIVLGKFKRDFWVHNQ